MFGRFENFLFWFILFLLVAVSIWFIRLPPRPLGNPENTDQVMHEPINNFTASEKGVGYLKITAYPEADTVYVDHIKFPQGTPYTGIFQSGEHRVKLINVNLNKVHETTIFLFDNERKIIHHNFNLNH